MNFSKIDALKEAVAFNDRPIFIEKLIPMDDILFDIANPESLRNHFINDLESVYVANKQGEEAIDLFETEQYAISIVNWGLPTNERVTEIVRQLSISFNDAIVGSHLYASKGNAKGFGYHFDSPMNIIVQINGRSKVRVSDMRANHCVSPEILGDLGNYRDILNNKVEETICVDQILEPGDAIYIPCKQFHCIEGMTDRISLSFPISCTEIVQGYRLGP